MSLRGPNNETRLNHVPDPTGTGSPIQQTDGGFRDITPKTFTETGFMLFLRRCASAVNNFFSKHEELGKLVLGIACVSLVATIGGIITLSWEILLVSLPVLAITGSLVLLSILDDVFRYINPSCLPQQ